MKREKIHFFEAGHGFPVLFLHGFCESGEVWKPIRNELAKHYRVLCADMPGFGQSPLESTEFTLQDIAGDLVHWLQSMGVDNTIVVGHSLGGYVALEMLRNYPELTRAIGLFNSSARADAPEKKENRNKLIEFIGKNGVEPFLKTFVPSLFYPETAKNHQKSMNQIYDDGLKISPQSVMSYAAAMRDRPDSMNLLAKYSNRILLIAGANDQNVPKSLSEEMAALLSPKHTHILPDSAHMCMFEQPEQSIMALRAFFEEQSRN